MLRASLHALAEQSGHESQTANLLQTWLEARGVRVETGIGGDGSHGLLAQVAGTSGGKVHLFRAELDAIPARDGARHGCGHDGHMVMVAAALAHLASAPAERPVSVLFQPSEEDGSGMARCLEDPRLSGLNMRDCYSIHNVPGYPMGALLLGPGALASQGVRLTFLGTESHAAQPGDGRSPWAALARLADAVEGLAMGLGPEALATLIHVRLGEEAYGTSPGWGTVAATLRGSAEDVEWMRSTWLELASEAAGDLDLELHWAEVDPFPETRNDDGALTAASEAALAVGMELVRLEGPFGWSEDFGHACARWPGALLGLGSGVDQPPLHDDRYEFPDVLLERGIQFWVQLARRA